MRTRNGQLIIPLIYERRVRVCVFVHGEKVASCRIDVILSVEAVIFLIEHFVI